MDYQEAIKEAEIQIDMYESMILYNKDFEPKNDNSNYERKIDFLKTAISAMQELQALHNQGISLKCLGNIGFRNEVIEHINYVQYKDLKDELEQYRQIGTLEEVLDAVEKQKAISREIIEGKYFCPKCHNLMPFPGYCGCGQRLY